MSIVHHSTALHVTNPDSSTATMTSLPPTSTPSKQALLYTEVRRADGTISRVPIKVNKTGCGCNEKQYGISQETMARIENVTERMNAYLRAPDVPDSSDDTVGEGIPHVRNARADWTSQRLIYSVNDEETSLPFTKVQDVGLRTLLLDIAKDVEHHSTSDPSTHSNRPMNRSTPLEIHTPTWYQHHHISAPAYVKTSHADLDQVLRTQISATIADEALPKIKAASNLIDKFRAELEGKLRTKETKLKSLAVDERSAKLAIMRQIRQLKALIEELNQQRLDTKAIFRSVPFANSNLQGFSNVKEQMTRVNLSREEMQTHLTTNIKAISEGWIFKSNPDAAFITAYSHDKGELLIHERWQYEETVDDRGGQKRGPSMEEFIVYNILNLKAGDDSVEEAMSSLALRSHEPADDEVRETIMDALKTAKQQVSAAYDTDLVAVRGHPGDLKAQTAALFPT